MNIKAKSKVSGDEVVMNIKAILYLSSYSHHHHHQNKHKSSVGGYDNAVGEKPKEN